MYSQLLEYAKHLYFCTESKNELTKINSDLLAQADRLYDAHEKFSNGDFHYNEEEIISYSSGKIEFKKRKVMIRHFTKCNKCVGILLNSESSMSQFIKDCLKR